MATRDTAETQDGARAIPRDAGLDATLAMWRDPYRYLSRRARALAEDVFQTRLLLRPTICMTGSEAARLFYDTRRFRRRGATPKGLQKTLFGEGGVQGLDGEEHARRKRMLLSLSSPEAIERLSATCLAAWRSAARSWHGEERVVLYRAAQEVLTRAVCAWAGVPLPEDEVPTRRRQLTALFDAAGSFGPRHLRARLARKRGDRWAARIVRDLRRHGPEPGEPTPAARVAFHRDAQGELLAPHVAAVELLNVLRPTVAVSVWVVALAHALHRHPGERERLRGGSAEARRAFVQEVRRLYPFFPAVPAVVRETFTWRGLRFPAGRRALLDLHGIDHDPRLWEAPEELRPERFRDRSSDPDPFELVPQGGGEHERNHRCAGEWITIALLETTLGFLVDELSYAVPPQDLQLDLRRLPALPQSRFVLSEARLGAPPPAAAATPRA